MAWTHVQDVQIQSSGTSIATSFASTVGSGHTVVGFFFYTSSSSSNQVTSIKDDLNNNYNIVQFVTGNPTQVYNAVTFYLSNITNAPKTITVTLSASTGNGWLTFGEFTPPSGTIAVDGFTGQYSTSNPPSAGSITTTNNGDLIFVGIGVNGGASTGTGYTAFTSNSGGLNAEYQTQTSAGSISGAWGGTPADYICLMFGLSATTSSSLPPGVQNYEGLTWSSKYPDGYNVRYRSWEHWLQQTPQVKNTFGGNYPWPNPQPITWYQNWTRSFELTNPFSQQDWPNPLRTTWYQFWTQGIPFGALQTPFHQSDWPNPQPISWYRTWTLSLNQTTLIPSTPNPFFQNVDSPLPVVSQPINQTWIQNLSEFLQSETFPFSQKDWPLPYPVQWYRDWHQALALYLPPVFPFQQTDWPNPRTYPPIDQFWSNNLNLLPQVNTTKPFNQNDWPNLRDYQRIEESFWQSLALILPPPPPPPEITSSGKTWTREEWTKKLTQYVQQRQKLLTFSEMGKMGGRPRKS